MQPTEPPITLSSVGFGDLPIARWAAPPLTTLRQSLADVPPGSRR